MIKNLRRRHKSIIVAVLCLMTTSAVSAYYILKPGQATGQSATGRNPASIQPVDLVKQEPTFFESDKKKVAASFETTLKLDCQDIFAKNAKQTSATVSSDHVILKFLRCNSTIAEIKKIELINKTNGYNAQLFKLNKAELNSDFIQLDKGENQLEFEISLNDGQKKLQILKIQRIQ